MQTSLRSSLIFLLFICQSCNNAAALKVEEKQPEKEKTAESSLSKEAQKLVGTWNFGHEPISYDFNADGSFKEYSPAGGLEPNAPEEIYTQGQWEYKEGRLLLKQEGKTEDVALHWIKDDLIFIGDLEGEYSEDFGTKEDFASEMGWFRKK